jgi:nitroreductase
MDIQQLMMERVSYRGEFQSTPVSREALRMIMEAGLAAPSGCNKQTTSLITVDEPELLEKIKKSIDPPICETAPAMIIVLTRRIYAYRQKCYSIQDYSAAIENMLLTITAMGYQSCWYEGHITDSDNIGRKLADILGVPGDYDAVCVLPVGYAAETAVRAKKKTFEERAWFNGFGKSGERE